MTARQREEHESSTRGVVVFAQKVGTLAGAALAVVALSGMIVRGVTTYAAAAFKDAASPLVTRLDRLEVRDSLSVEQALVNTQRIRVIGQALSYGVASQRRDQVLARLDSLDVAEQRVMLGRALGRRRTGD